MSELKLKTCIDHLETKSLEDGSVYIEGWANKAVVDRGKDLISSKAWDLGNYKKNSIILFNHDHSKPIGKMIAVEPKDDGLFVKGRISNSKDPEISRIRDLVKEGILNSLSVGIMVRDEDMKDGVNVIKSVELHEVSVVAVPMNQDSQFTVTAKSMQGSLVDVMTNISREVGTKDVAMVYQKLHEQAEELQDLKAAARFLSKAASCPEALAHDFLTLKILDTPKAIKRWLTKGTDMEEKPMEEEKMEKPAEEEKPDEEMKAEEQKAMDVHGVRVPKEAFASQEELLSWAEESGWKTDNILEEDASFLLVQRPAEDFEGEFEEADMGDGVIGIIGKLKEDGEEKPEEEKPEEEVSIEVEMSREEKAGIADRFNEETQVAISGGEGNPPSWVADEALWEKAKRASEAALGEVSYAFVVWWYMDQGGSKKSMDTKQALLDDSPAMTQPIPGMTAEQIEVNPTLDQAKQTNVLLSSMVSLLQQLNEKFDSMPVQPAPMQSSEPVESMSADEEQMDEEMAKKLEKFMLNTESRLKNLGL